MIIIDDQHVYQFFSEIKDFPMSLEEFPCYSWEIESASIQFRNAYVSLVAEGKRAFFFCKVII